MYFFCITQAVQVPDSGLLVYCTAHIRKEKEAYKFPITFGLQCSELTDRRIEQIDKDGISLLLFFSLPSHQLGEQQEFKVLQTCSTEKSGLLQNKTLLFDRELCKP